MVSDIEVLRLKLELVTAERDRLRAVVKNIRDYTANLPGEKMSRVWAVTEQVLERGEVSVLDVSPITGDQGEDA